MASPVNEPPRRASQRIRAARAYRRPSGLSATILAFSIIFVLAYVFLLRTPPPVPTPQLQALRGTYTWKAQQTSGSGQDIAAPSGSGTFSAVAGGDAGGSFRGPASAGGMTAVVVAAYDAGTRTESASASGAAGPGKHFIAVEGVWPPAWRLATRSPLDYQGLAAVVRAAVEDGDRNIGIKPLKEGERKVWRAAMTLDGEPVELVVDQLSGIVTWYADPRATFTAEVAWDSPPPEGQSFTVAPPNGATVARRTDRTYTYEVSPAAAGTAAGFAPLSSDLAPDGYTLAAVATAAAPELPDAWLGGGSRGGRTRGATGRATPAGGALPARPHVVHGGAAGAGVRRRCRGASPEGSHDGRVGQALVRAHAAELRRVRRTVRGNVVRALRTDARGGRRELPGARHRRAHAPGAPLLRRGPQAPRRSAGCDVVHAGREPLALSRPLNATGAGRRTGAPPP